MKGKKLFTRIFVSFLAIETLIFLTLFRWETNFFIESAVVFLLSVFASYFISRYICRPLEEIRKGAEDFASGNLNQQISVSGSEEMEALADSLNRMAKELKKRIEKISLQKSEQEAMFLSMKEGVLAINSSEQIIRVNRATLDFFNIDEQPVNLKRRPVYEIIRNADMLEFIRKSLNTDGHLEEEITVLGEKEMVLLVNADPLYNAEKKKIGTLIVMNDITRVKEWDKMRQEFVANVSHELKTPITSIKGYVETLLGGDVKDAATQERFLRIIAKHSERLNAIISDLLQLAKLDKAKEINLEEKNLLPILETAVQNCTAEARGKDIKIEISCGADLKAKVNESLLERAIINLLENALRYSDTKRILAYAEKKGENILIGVKDWGVGIAKEHHERLFERFYRVDKGRSRESGGTGLGLSIVKHIALAHNGRAKVESEIGKGSNFVIELPVI
jgi:two-component system phosphate regulon sensor histidine kinase PhoR